MIFQESEALKIQPIDKLANLGEIGRSFLDYVRNSNSHAVATYLSLYEYKPDYTREGILSIIHRVNTTLDRVGLEFRISPDTPGPYPLGFGILKLGEDPAQLHMRLEQQVFYEIKSRVFGGRDSVLWHKLDGHSLSFPRFEVGSGAAPHSTVISEGNPDPFTSHVVILPPLQRDILELFVESGGYLDENTVTHEFAREVKVPELVKFLRSRLTEVLGGCFLSATFPAGYSKDGDPKLRAKYLHQLFSRERSFAKTLCRCDLSFSRVLDGPNGTVRIMACRTNDIFRALGYGNLPVKVNNRSGFLVFVKREDIMDFSSHPDFDAVIEVNWSIYRLLRMFQASTHLNFQRIPKYKRDKLKKIFSELLGKMQYSGYSWEDGSGVSVRGGVIFPIPRIENR